MNPSLILKSRPPPLRLLIFHPALLYVTAQQQQPLYSIASFDSSSNFALEPACSSIYRRSIPSCQLSDFNAINPCSSLCIETLQSIQTEAQVACGSQGGIPTNSLLAFFRNGTGVNQLCVTVKGGTAATLIPQASQVAGGGGTQTVPPGAGGVSTATEVPADQSKATSMDLGNGGVVAIIIIVIVGSVLLLLASFFYYNKYYNKKS